MQTEITNKRKLWILMAILVANGAINLLFFEHRMDYLQDYKKAKEKMEAIERDYAIQTLHLKQKQDSLTGRLVMLDSVMEKQEMVLKPIVARMLHFANSDWEKLSESEKAQWTELAIKQISNQ